MSGVKYSTLSLDEETDNKLTLLASKEHRSKASQVKHLIEKEIVALGLKYKKEAAA